MASSIVTINNIENVESLEMLESIIKEYNDNIQDNQKNRFTFSQILKATEKVNENTKKAHTFKFLNELKDDRKKAFGNLLSFPNYEKISISEKNDNTIEVKKLIVINQITDIERAYQIQNSVEKDKFGRPIINKGVTIFGAMRFYNLVESFIRNLLINQVEGDGAYKTDLSRVKIDDKQVFTEKDGEYFSKNSNEALDKQMRVLTVFFGELPIHTKKKDIPLLKSQVVKIKFKANEKSLDFSEQKANGFLKILYKYFISAYNNHNTILSDRDGKAVNFTEKKTKAEKAKTE